MRLFTTSSMTPWKTREKTLGSIRKSWVTFQLARIFISAKKYYRKEVAYIVPLTQYTVINTETFQALTL